MKKITVIIPALNEEKNIAKVIKYIQKVDIIDEIIIVDNNSTDRTREIVMEHGITPLICEKRGKGYAMECGLKAATGDYILYMDADICNYKKGFINDMIEPLVNEGYDFVKSNFSRDGGRITELVAKPLLELTFPKLATFGQPLSGIIAGKKKLFKKIKFEKDYGVDIGILIDSYQLRAKIKEVNIGKIINDSQDWKDLTHMARQVSRAILKRKLNIEKLKHEKKHFKCLKQKDLL